MTPTEVAIALLPAAGVGFALGWFVRGFGDKAQQAADRAELANLRSALSLPTVKDMLLDKGIRVGATTGKLWGVAEAAAALASVDTVQELAALSDDLLPRQEPGLPGVGPIRGKPPWRQLAEERGLLPAQDDPKE